MQIVFEYVLNALPAWLVILLCSFIQGVFGFAFSLFALPLLLLMNYNLPDAVALSVISSAAQRILFIYHMREFVEWRSLKMIIFFGILGLPVGLLVLIRIAGQSQETIQQFVGGLLVLTVIIYMSLRPKPQNALAQFWGLCAAFFSGFLGGMANIGGPPFVFWVYSHNWPALQLRATTVGFAVAMIPFQFILLYLAFHFSIFDAFLVGLFSFPLVYIGTRIGIWVGHKIKVEKLRFAVFALLFVMGLYHLLESRLF
jgi:uncharacterized membrane protein YfcA